MLWYLSEAIRANTKKKKKRVSIRQVKRFYCHDNQFNNNTPTQKKKREEQKNKGGSGRNTQRLW